MFERKVTLQQSITQNSVEVWNLLHEEYDPDTRSNKMAAIKRGSSATELLAWCHFNRLINPGTIVSLEAKAGSLKVEETKNILAALEEVFPNGEIPNSSIEDLEKPSVAVGACIFMNVGSDPFRGSSRRYSHLENDNADVLNAIGPSSNLAFTFDLVIVTSWQEILTYRYSGIEGFLDCLCQYLRWNNNSVKVNDFKFSVFNYSFPLGGKFVKRIEQLFSDVIRAYSSGAKRDDIRYILEVEQTYVVVYRESENFYYYRADTERELFNKLSEPLQEGSRFVVDKHAFKDTIVAEVFKQNENGKIQLFYEEVGHLATIYILDEQGAAFHQKLPFHEDMTLINQYMAFFDTTLNRKAVELNDPDYAAMIDNIEFYKVTRASLGYAQFEQKFSDYDKSKRSYFYVQVVGSIMSQTRLTEDRIIQFLPCIPKTGSILRRITVLICSMR